MEQILRYELFAVLLGNTRGARALARILRTKAACSAILVSDKRPLIPSALSCLPHRRLPLDASDELLLSALLDIEVESGTALPLLVVCDARYAGLVARRREELERRYVLRDVKDLLEVRA